MLLVPLHGLFKLRIFELTDSTTVKDASFSMVNHVSEASFMLIQNLKLFNGTKCAEIVLSLFTR